LIFGVFFMQSSPHLAKQRGITVLQTLLLTGILGVVLSLVVPKLLHSEATTAATSSSQQQ